MEILPFRYADNEYASLIELQHIIEPEDRLTVEYLRENDRELEADNDVVRVVGEQNHQVIAHGVYWHPIHSKMDDYQFTFFVHPDYQNGPVSDQMHHYLLSRIEQNRAASIASEAKENESYRIQLLENSKFELKMRFPRSRLDVSGFDTPKYDDLKAELCRQGIKISTLSDVMETDPNWQRNIWKMFTIIDQDVPSAEPEETTPFEVYAKYYEGEFFRPDSWAIAIDKSSESEPRYVGLCVVNIMPTRPDTLFAGITGVLPDYRRRKIATMLKVYSIQYAQGQGYQYIYTDNEEDNPMYILNLQLGFEPLPAWVYYKKQILS